MLTLVITPGNHLTIEEDIVIIAMDNAENEVQALAGKVRYDACEPVINVALMSGNTGVSGWFSEKVNENPLYLAIQYNDDTSVQKIQVSGDDSFNSILWEQEVNKASGTVTTMEGFISGEQDKEYYVRAIDRIGNISGNRTVQVRIDNTKPSAEVSVAFSGSDSMRTTLELSDGEGYHYKIASIEGSVSDTQTITMKIYLADAQQNYPSGIDTAELTLLYENETRTYQCARGGGDLIIETDEDGNDFISFTTEVFSSNGKVEADFQIMNLSIVDKAGNIRTSSDEISFADKVTYSIDNKEPEILFLYNNEEIEPIADTWEEEDAYYYSKKYEGSVHVSDKNLDKNCVEIINLSSDAQAQIVHDAQESNTFDLFKFYLNDDGCYQLGAKAADVLKNETSNMKSKPMIVDTVAPQVEIQVNGKTMESTEQELYFNKNMDIAVTVEEKNLKAITMEIESDGRNAIQSTYTENDFQKNEDGQHYFHVQLTEDGEYSVNIICTDKAGHKTEKLVKGLILDKTAPKVTITYDNMEARNEYYYNAQRIATITVEDLTFSKEDCDWSVTTAKGNHPMLGAWVRKEQNIYTSQVVFDKDDIYDVSFQCTDKAGNKSEVCNGGHFVIDRQAPVITFEFNNYDCQNEFYYKEGRIAYVVVDDLSFDADLVKVEPVEGENRIRDLTISSWNGTEVLHIGSVECQEEGGYEFIIHAEDLAGNTTESVSSGYFIIDKTAPELKIEGIEHLSANNGELAPRISYSDLYLDDQNSKIEFYGSRKGVVNLEGEMQKQETNISIQYHNIPVQREMDDLYTLSVLVKDMAGNEVEETVNFSVNRFGSVYSLSEQTRQLVEQYYTNEEQDIVISEINVDNLAEQKITVSWDGEPRTLRKGRDYRVDKQGDDASWKSYTYTIYKNNFKKEGQYMVTLLSRDIANNQTDSNVQNTEISFAIDKTAPSIVVAGLEEGESYHQKEREVKADIQDNMGLANARVLINGIEKFVYSQEDLENAKGEISFVIPESDEKMQVVIEAVDMVGNTSQKQYSDILITTSLDRVEEEETAMSSGPAVVISEQKNPVWIAILTAGITIGIAIILILLFNQLKEEKKRNEEE